MNTANKPSQAALERSSHWQPGRFWHHCVHAQQGGCVDSKNVFKRILIHLLIVTLGSI